MLDRSRAPGVRMSDRMRESRVILDYFLTLTGKRDMANEGANEGPQVFHLLCTAYKGTTVTTRICIIIRLPYVL